jgi:hypothetical protein
MKTKITLILIPLCIVSLISCKKLIEVGRPENQLATETVFSDSTTAISALSNIYALFNNSIDVVLNPNISVYGDDLNVNSAATQSLEFLQSSVSPTNQTNLAIWRNFYSIIYSSNNLIDQLNASTKLPADKVKMLICEAKFLRAFSYFYLVNLYGKVPLLVTTNVDDNSKAYQTDTSTVYNQIIRDLSDAQNGLSISYPTAGKVRANSMAATSMLARVYLYQKRWADAESAASKVISSGLYTPLVPVTDVFKAGGKESIFQFWTQNGYVSTGPILIPSSGQPGYAITPGLLTAFEGGDRRKSTWINSIVASNVTYYYPYKYHNRVANTTGPEYLTALRIGEQYLIRAEARINQSGKIADGVADLNIVRARARDVATMAVPNPLPALSLNMSQSDALIAIAHERQVELFAEWGQRFFDLKRSGKVNLILGNLKTTWRNNVSIYLPIPQNELIYDANLQQNPGY